MEADFLARAVRSVHATPRNTCEHETSRVSTRVSVPMARASARRTSTLPRKPNSNRFGSSVPLSLATPWASKGPWRRRPFVNTASKTRSATLRDQSRPPETYMGGTAPPCLAGECTGRIEPCLARTSVLPPAARPCPLNHKLLRCLAKTHNLLWFSGARGDG